MVEPQREAATTSGSVAIRIAASDEEMRCSPKPISGKGTTISAMANSTSQRSGKAA